MKKLISFLIIVFSTSTYQSITPNYNHLTNKIFCYGSNCIHEVGHFIDQNSGWISSSKEFREYFYDASFYGINGIPRKKYSREIVDFTDIYPKIFGWGGWKEFYAHTFMDYYGCENIMPESIRKFYDFKTAYDKLKQYGFYNDKTCPVIESIIHSTATLQ